MSRASRCGKRAVKIALADQGYHESPAGSNLQKFGARLHMNGYAWCGYAADCWLIDAGFNVTHANAVRHGYVPTLLQDARLKQHGVFIVGWNRVRPGDRVCYDFQADRVADHVGIFVRWIDKKRGFFLSIEGNTSKAGSQSNGGAVVLQTRHTSQVSGCVRTTRTRKT